MQLNYPPRVKATLEELVKAGANQNAVIRHLFVICWSVSLEQDRGLRQKRKRWKMNCGAPEGMTWPQFQRRIGSFARLANEIEKINNSPYYHLDRWVPFIMPGEKFGHRNLTATFHRVQMRKELARLPELLRLYSAFLEQASGAVRAELYTLRKPSAINSGSARSALLRYVKTATQDDPHSFKHVATLLDWAYKGFGIKSPRIQPDIGVDPDSLRRQLNREKQGIKRA